MLEEKRDYGTDLVDICLVYGSIMVDRMRRRLSCRSGTFLVLRWKNETLFVYVFAFPLYLRDHGMRPYGCT